MNKENIMTELKVYIVVYSVPYEGCETPDFIFLSEEKAHLKCEELNEAERFGSYEVLSYVVIQ